MKKILIALSVLAVWLTCSYIDYGYALGEFTALFPEQSATAQAYSIAAFGPFALPTVYFFSDTDHAWRTTPMTYEERWGAFHKEFPTLTRACFDGSEKFGWMSLKAHEICIGDSN